LSPTQRSDQPSTSNSEQQAGTAKAASTADADGGDSGATRVASADARDVALAVARSGLERKASGIEILDVCGKVDYTDLIVLMTGRSDRHVHAIAKGLEQDLGEKLGLAPISVEGLQASNWVLLDFNDVVVHVFQEDTRCFYDLEGLWIDASRLNIPEPSVRPEAAPGDGLV
jgi:ribosome-associated protein